MKDAVLIYPRLGSLDSVVADLPLSIIYAAADSVDRGHAVELLDLRCLEGDWRPALRRALEGGVRLVGVSVMTGQPLINAREISLFVREVAPGARIVWGGPHVTILPETVQEPFIDFCVRGYGSRCLAELVEALREGREDFTGIDGLSWKRGGQAIHNARPPFHELVPHAKLPYHLVDFDSPAYRRAYTNELMFSMFTSIGCPYKCAFCVHPTVYEVINPPKWVPIPEAEVVAHMEFAVQRFGVSNICIIDDTSFPDLKRMRRIFELLLERGLKVTLEFRGARINEMDNMDDAFIRLMIRAGTRVLKVGAESASDRMLKVFKKRITREQILRVNRKFARYPELVVDYNFFCGAPKETYDDLLTTKNTVMQLIRENPGAYYSFGSDWKPIPGSALLDVAEKEYGFRAPKTLDEWAEMDSFDSKEKIFHPWYTRKHDNLIKMMQLAAFAIDNKIVNETAENTTPLFRFLRLMSRLYKPLALFRLKYDVYGFMLEYDVQRFLMRNLGKMKELSERIHG